MNFIFTQYAKRQWEKLPASAQERMRKKLIFIKSEPAFSKQLKIVASLEPATHRLRVGSYRLLLCMDFSKKETLVLKIAHRREIYR